MDFNATLAPNPGETVGEFMNRVLPQVLPNNAVRVVILEDNQIGQYLTLTNTPTTPYIADKIHDGHEFAVGGDINTILWSLGNRLNSFPPQNWHIVAIPESNIQRSNALRWPPRAPIQGGRVQYNPYHGGGLMQGGPAPPPPQAGNFQDANIQPSLTPQQALPNPPQVGYDGCGAFIGPSGQDQPAQPAQPAQAPPPPNKHVHHFTHQDAKLLRSFEAFQRKQDTISAVLDADEVMGDYTGTNLCRWCGREGHEAVECFKFDPEHLDKLVCVACNNRKHVIDECAKFTTEMSVEEQAALLLDAGAGRPGVRSFFYPWTNYLLPEKPNRATPLTRAYLRYLLRTNDRYDWMNLWHVWDYGASGLPREFNVYTRLSSAREPGQVGENPDETFTQDWPLIRRDSE